MASKQASGHVQSEKRKFTPRPTRPVEERLPRLYRALTDQVDDGHFANAIKTCRKILTLDKTSVSAYQTLLFLYLQTDDYPAALNLLENPPSANQKLDYERAYCLYRLNREQEALEVLGGLAKRGEKEDQLEAQIRYRMGEYNKTQELYEGLLARTSSSDPDHADILNNLSSTTKYIDYMSNGYHQHLYDQANTPAYVPTEATLESHIPNLPKDWAAVGRKDVPVKRPVVAASSAAREQPKESVRRKPRHRLPKGAVLGKPFNEDPERWLPLKQRQSYMQAQNKKKGANLSMGTGMTQGSTTSAPGASTGGGGKKKKGKK